MTERISMLGTIPTHTLKQDYIRIENSKQYKEDVKRINPLNESQYLKYWMEIKKRVIEGIWGQESGGYRFCPPSLYFYTNFGIIQDTDESGNTLYIKPLIQDLEWEMHYALFEAEGFSGFYKDEDYTSDEMSLTYNQNDLPKTFREKQLFNSKGEYKKYISPRENIRKLHEYPKGQALYFNKARNFMLLGSRSGGKSYTMGIGRGLHLIVVDGSLYYNEGQTYLLPDYKEKVEGKSDETIVEVVIGSGDTDKSSELLGKIVEAMNALATRPEFGVWGSIDEEDYMPCPLYKDMKGSTQPGNKKNPWRHEYDVIKGGRKIQQGTGSKITHVSYSAMKGKGKGAQAAAGGRVKLSIIEEVGLCFGKNTKVRMLNGSTKDVQDIVSGDLIMGEDGGRRTVINTNKGKDTMYKVNQTFGEDYIVNSKHPLMVKYKSWKKGNNKIQYKEIAAENYNSIKNIRTHYGYKNQCINFSKKEVDLDPYVLGYWLGDGCINKTSICTEDCEVIDYFKKYCKSLNLRWVKENNNKSGNADNYHMSGTRGKNNPVRSALKKYKTFTNKFIHLDYIHNDLNTRLNLLAGLIDSDGCYVQTKTMHAFEFYQTNRLDLIEKVEYLCQSLGFRVLRKERITNKGYDNKILSKYRTKYILRISGDIHTIPTKVKRKQAKKRIYKKDFLNTSIKVSKLKEDTYYGFTLEEASTFLLKDGTVAHNTELAIEAYNSNVNIVARNGRQFGVQGFLGTSGNIDAVQAAKKMFTNPQDYNLLAYPDVWEGMGRDGKIAFFLPAYMVLRQYKDEDGNTDYQKAFKHIYELRQEAAKSSDKSVLRVHKMNNPIIPTEMWITEKGHYLPHEEAIQREKELVKNNKYLNLAQAVNLVWDSNYPNGIKHTVNIEAEPFYIYPLPSTMINFDSSIVIYDYPKDHSPNDFYFATHDPYVSDNIDKGGSFGATHVFINPKYWDEYMPQTGPMVATYIAKPTNGLKGYYLEQEKLLAFYNSPIRGLAYEANRGSNCKNYYFNKQKTHILSLRPQVFDRSSVFLNRTTEYGYMTTNVIEDLDRTNDFLLTYLPKLQKRVIETIPCLFTIKQIILFELKGNYDAVSSIMIAPKHIGVMEQERQDNAIGKRLKNELAFFSTNNYLKNNDNNYTRHTR